MLFASRVTPLPAAIHSCCGRCSMSWWTITSPLALRAPRRVLAMGPRVVTRSIVARLGRLSAAASAARGGAGGAWGWRFGRGAWSAGGAVGRRGAAGGGRAGARLDPHPEEGFRFAHPIVRNAVYRDLAPDERDRLHREAAALLEAAGAAPERVAAQLLAVDPAGDERVCVTLRRVAEIARVVWREPLGGGVSAAGAGRAMP